MSYTNIWIHAVWATKNRKKLIYPKIRKLVFSHIKEMAKEKEIYIDFINGSDEHVHILLLVARNQNLSDIIRNIKGESSYWINENKIIREHFLWQDDYYAVSISPSHLKIVRDYIRNQRRHHTKISWEAEIRCFMDDLNPSAKADGNAY